MVADMTRDSLSIRHAVTSCLVAILPLIWLCGCGPPRDMSSSCCFEKVTAGHTHSCAIADDASVHCWGEDDFHGKTDPPNGAFTDIHLLQRASCGLRADGTIDCWGYTNLFDAEVLYGTFSQLAGRCGLHEDGEIRCFDGPSPPSEIQAISAIELSNSCAIDDEQAIHCWGAEDTGQTEPPQGEYHGLSSTSSVGCALDASDEIRCWGSARSTQRPNEHLTLPSPPSGSFEQVSVGGHHICAVTTTGDLDCWALHDEEETRYGQADPPEGLFMQVSAGSRHSCAVDTDGRIHCWGYNADGQINPP